jgi:hypothetical protein
MGRTNKGLGRLWRPGGDTLEVIAGELSAHWRAAARLTPTQLFWHAPARWLKVEPLGATLQPHHFATGGRLIR